MAHLLLDRTQDLIVDLEAGVEHLGRGTVADVDGLIVVAEPSWRSLAVAAQIAGLAAELGLVRQALVLNRAPEGTTLPDIPGLPPLAAAFPLFSSLSQRQLTSPSVLQLSQRDSIDQGCRAVLNALTDRAASDAGGGPELQPPR